MTVYPISEIFISPQGEGLYTGTLMAFVRLAGCSVGKPFPKEKYAELPIYTEQCTLYDGRKFACDTDYRVKERLTVEQIFDRIKSLEGPSYTNNLGVGHVCLTGGEPFIHELDEFYDACLAKSIQLHVETSGTIPLGKAFKLGATPLNPWKTVSPKHKVLPEMISLANEIKLLIDDDFKFEALPEEIRKHRLVYIQPVNYENEVNPQNLKLVMDLQQKMPHWRVSLQLHKVLSKYLGELVR